MRFSFAVLTFGALLSLGTGGCKREAPAPAIAESARPTPSAPASASAAPPPAPTAAAYGPEDVAADLYGCARYWWLSVKNEQGRCAKLLPLWSEGGVDAAVRKYKAGCDGGDGRSCLLLVGGIPHPQSPLRAKDEAGGNEEMARLLVKACELGEPNACLVLTQQTRCTGDPSPFAPAARPDCNARFNEWLRGKGHAELAAVLDPGCKKGHARSCTERGRHLRETSASVDEPQALYTRGCELGDAEGCSYAAGVAKTLGQEEERKAFIKKMFALQERECLRFLDCSGISLDYRSGALLPEQTTRVRELSSFMCEKMEASDERCLALADMQAAGEGGPVDVAAAIRRYQAVCDKPISDEMMAIEIEPIARACRSLARLYRSGNGVPKDEAKAKKSLERACVQRTPSSNEIDAACSELSAMSKGK
jgi:hypothetical protein